MNIVFTIMIFLVLSTLLTKEYVNCKSLEDVICSTLIVVSIIQFIFLIKQVPELNVEYPEYSSVVAATFLFITLNLLIWAIVISWVAQKKGGYSKLKDPDEEGIISLLTGWLMRLFVLGFMLAIIVMLITWPEAELVSLIILGLTAGLLGGFFLGLAEGYPKEFRG